MQRQTSRKAAFFAAVLTCACSGCGTYLHNDQFQSDASSAKTSLAKINLTQSFSDQLTRVSSYNADEDKAVASFAVADRNRQLQQMIGLPGWTDPKAPSGPAALAQSISGQLTQLIGRGVLTSADKNALDAQSPLTGGAALLVDNDRAALQNAIYSFQQTKDSKDKRATNCPTPPPKGVPYPANFVSADDWFAAIQYWCGQLATDSHPFRSLRAQFTAGDLNGLLTAYYNQVDTQNQEVAAGAALQAEIDKLDKQVAAGKSSTDQLVDKLKSLQKDLKSASGAAKFLGYEKLVSTLNDVVAVEVSSPSSGTAPVPAASADDMTKRAQAAIALALALNNLGDISDGDAPIQRLNSLILAKAGALHQMALAKLETDYASDLIKIYAAEINARVRQLRDLWNAERALRLGRPGAPPLSPKGFAALRGTPEYDHQIDALAAWVAAQDDGEIPYQVLHIREIQALRVYSVRQGQAAAQGYTDLLTPIVAELDAYGQGGLTTQTLVQALGFAGVISSISSK